MPPPRKPGIPCRCFNSSPEAIRLVVLMSAGRYTDANGAVRLHRVAWRCPSCTGSFALLGDLQDCQSLRSLSKREFINRVFPSASSPLRNRSLVARHRRIAELLRHFPHVDRTSETHDQRDFGLSALLVSALPNLTWKGSGAECLEVISTWLEGDAQGFSVTSRRSLERSHSRWAFRSVSARMQERSGWSRRPSGTEVAAREGLEYGL